MKHLILILALSATSVATSQLEVTTSTKVDIYKTSDRMYGRRTITLLEDGSLFLTYKNAEYQHISDYQSLTFSNIDEMLQFLDLCDTAIANTNVDYTTESYSLNSKSAYGTFVFDLQQGVPSRFFLKPDEIANMRLSLNQNKDDKD